MFVLILIAVTYVVERKKLILIYCIHSSHFRDYMETQGHLVGKEESNIKKSVSFSLHVYDNDIIDLQQVQSSIHTHHQVTVEIVVLYFILGATKNRLTNTPSVSGNSTPCDHLILPVLLCKT